MNDGWEFINGLDPLFDDADEDPDKDKLKNLDEFLNNTLAQNPDSDMDSLSDSWEIINGWDPLKNAIEMILILMGSLTLKSFVMEQT